MITVVETTLFTRQVEDLFDDEGRTKVIDFLAQNPVSGDAIPDTGGVRKVRVAASGRGKRGGARVIYFYHDDAHPLYALLVYAKNVQADLTPDEKKAVKTLVDQLKTEWKRKKP